MSPLDPRVAIVAGHAHRPEGRRVFAGITQDAGETWTLWNATAPAGALPADIAEGKTFDPSVAAGVDGALHVLYIADAPAKAPVEGRLVLATTRDAGVSWDVNALPGPSALLWDYASLAASPDGGGLYAVSNVVGAGPWFWRSEDDGATWADPMPLAALAGSASRPPVSIPHVAAGRDGLVAVSVRSDGKLFVTTSVDAGSTFAPLAVAIPDVGGAVGRALVARSADEPLELFAGIDAKLVRAVAPDATRDHRVRARRGRARPHERRQREEHALGDVARHPRRRHARRWHRPRARVRRGASARWSCR